MVQSLVIILQENDLSSKSFEFISNSGILLEFGEQLWLLESTIHAWIHNSSHGAGNKIGVLGHLGPHSVIHLGCLLFHSRLNLLI